MPKRDLAFPTLIILLVALLWAIIAFLLGVSDAGAWPLTSIYS